MAQAVNPATTVSPKVKVPTYVGLLISLLGAVVAAVATWGLGITPESFDGLGLGVWALPLATLVTTAAQRLAGWWATDPLRVATSVPGREEKLILAANHVEEAARYGGDTTFDVREVVPEEDKSTSYTDKDL